MGKPPARALRLALLTIALAASASPARAGDPGSGTLPNLRPQAPYGIRMGSPDSGSPTALPFALRLSLTAMNVGDYPLELVSQPSGNPDFPYAVQCVRYAWARACFERRAALYFTYHAAHAHYHVDGYATYELRRIKPDRTPDLSPSGWAGAGTKASFCLLDLQRHTRHPEDPFTDTGYFRGCGPNSQGISQGWSDIYSSGLSGQQILLDGVPDGEYSLVVNLNPWRKLYETSYADNLSWQNVRISNNRTTVTPIP